jgi:hypothetical protein
LTLGEQVFNLVAVVGEEARIWIFVVFSLHGLPLFRRISVLIAPTSGGYVRRAQLRWWRVAAWSDMRRKCMDGK